MPIVPRKRPDTAPATAHRLDSADPPFATADQMADTPEPPAVSDAAHARRRGHASKDKNGKWQPTGDYEVGFGRPPKATQFNGKPGPGRPKGTINFDKLLKKHLTEKRNVRIGGRERMVTNAELIIMTMIKDAVEGKGRDARKFALAEMARTLVPEEASSRSLSQEHLNESDALSLAEFERDIRDQMLSELLGGELDEGNSPQDRT